MSPMRGRWCGSSGSFGFGCARRVLLAAAASVPMPLLLLHDISRIDQNARHLRRYRACGVLLVRTVAAARATLERRNATLLLEQLLTLLMLVVFVLLVLVELLVLNVRHLATAHGRRGYGVVVEPQWGYCKGRE